jgi:hypothetical protein
LRDACCRPRLHGRAALRVPVLTDFVAGVTSDARAGRGRAWWLAALA